MYTYVNILYSVNKELNWIELNWAIKKLTEELGHLREKKTSKQQHT